MLRRFSPRLVAALLLTLAPLARAAEPPLSYTRDIRPILAANCFACHGADAHSRKADLRLDTFEGATVVLDGKKPIAPGKPEASEVIARVTTTDPDDVMPPPKTGRKLTPEQIATLKRWIAGGAVYEQHWSFRKLEPVKVPAVVGEIKNPIDALVLARLQQDGLAPEPAADHYTLIRRVSLDLTGLPPTPEEADAFVADTSAGAYEKVVDRLLASKRFGEHWARMWLDLARYADTKGYEKDQPRQIWRYRDWVIDAFNADMPYDQFTVKQLAGDLLPGATESDILATAFHRNTMTNDEGGTDDEEFRVAAVKDRVDTTIQVWMGLTMGCAKCHSHKYDPISIHDYYSFYAIWNQSEDSDKPTDVPVAPMPTEEQKARLAAAEAKLKAARDVFRAPRPELASAQAEWEAGLAKQNVWTVLKPGEMTSREEAKLRVLGDGAIFVQGRQGDTDVYTLTCELPKSDRPFTALRLEALPHAQLPKGGPGRDKTDANFVISELTVKLGDQPAKLTSARADFSQNNWPAAAAIDGKDDTGWAISPQQGKPHVLLLDFQQPVAATKTAQLVITITQNYPKLQLGHFRLAVSAADPATLKPEQGTLTQIAAKPAAKRTAAEQQQLTDAFRGQHPATIPLAKAVASAESQLEAIRKEVPSIPIMRDLPAGKRRVSKIHNRGNFLDQGDEVKPAVLSNFNPRPEHTATDRLAAAKWLMSPENPLTARVMVNRIWARLFGVGLVETEEDFGLQGAAPSHPELLDWLAVEFRFRGWSIKQLLKTIVMSGTYQQSAKVTPEKLAKDPRNVLLSRGPRFRLAAEIVRDQALASSGLLSPKMHGPSVMPPQPPGLWKAAYSSLKWETSPGEDRYRRGLYTFLRRTSPHPAMTTFDAGSGEVCLIRRVRTNTPLQALVTLNDPEFIEAAGALAKVMNTSDIATGFRRVLTRPASPTELARLEKLFETNLADYTRDLAAARELLASANVTCDDEKQLPKLAALTVVGNVLLNLDETLTKP